jgi:hypothetical protein
VICPPRNFGANRNQDAQLRRHDVEPLGAVLANPVQSSLLRHWVERQWRRRSRMGISGSIRDKLRLHLVRPASLIGRMDLTPNDLRNAFVAHRDMRKSW